MIDHKGVGVDLGGMESGVEKKFGEVEEGCEGEKAAEVEERGEDDEEEAEAQAAAEGVGMYCHRAQPSR